MNPTFLGGAAALLLCVLWWSGRRRPVQLLGSTSTAAIAALNRAQIAAVQESAAAASLDAGENAADPAAAGSAVRPGPGLPQALLLRRLSGALTQEPATRLQALRQARAWGDRATVPLLLRGLRDSDPAVVREAVLAMERFRGRARAPGAAQEPVFPLPRNVARSR
jgi:hypothetical protein